MAVDMKLAMLLQSEERCTTARARMLWHLEQLAQWVRVDGSAFGSAFDDHMANVAKWRAEFDAAYAERLKWLWHEGAVDG